jgi:hypothetical protein
MTEQQPADGQPPDEQRKRRRWRIHLDDLKADWSPSGGLTLAGTGFIGTLVVVLVWWVHQS